MDLVFALVATFENSDLFFISTLLLVVGLGSLLFLWYASPSWCDLQQQDVFAILSLCFFMRSSSVALPSILMRFIHMRQGCWHDLLFGVRVHPSYFVELWFKTYENGCCIVFSWMILHGISMVTYKLFW